MFVLITNLKVQFYRELLTYMYFFISLLTTMARQGPPLQQATPFNPRQVPASLCDRLEDRRAIF